MVLLGAGASMDAGLPNADGLLAKLRIDPSIDTKGTALLDALAARVSDLEQVAAVAMHLAEIESPNFWPFLDISEPAFRTSDTVDFRDLYWAMLQAIPGQLRADSDQDLAYLDELTQSCHAAGAVIATLNYDLLIEEAADRLGIDADSGIHAWQKTGAIVWADGTLRLLKLHGSADWPYRLSPLQDDDGRALIPLVTVAQAVEALEPHDLPNLIFGATGKLRPDGPFLGLLAQFKAELAAVDQLLVIGYGWRDEHVSQAIFQWLNRHSGANLTIVDPSFPRSLQEAEATPALYLLYSTFLLAGIDTMTDKAGPRVTPLHKTARDFLNGDLDAFLKG